MANATTEREMSQRWNTRSTSDRTKILELYYLGLAYVERCLPGIHTTLAASNWSNLPPIVQAAIRRNFYAEGGQ